MTERERERKKERERERKKEREREKERKREKERERGGRKRFLLFWPIKLLLFINLYTFTFWPSG